jgi:hypothetical protein
MSREIDQAASLRSPSRCRPLPFRHWLIHQTTKGKPVKEAFMDRQAKQHARSTWESVARSELTQVSGGIWDYSNRLGPFLGQMLEDRQDRNYGDPFGTKTLDEAAHQALEGWVSIP